MVCKNCGSDLKPGVKYCLNCGNYLDDEEIEENKAQEVDELDLDVSDGEDESTEEAYQFGFDELTPDESTDKKNKKETKKKSKKKKRKKLKMSSTDMMIYGGLCLVIIISLIIMVSSIVRSKKKAVDRPQTEIKVSDNEVSIDNYKIKFSGKLNYSQEKSVIFITDGENYSFSYKNTKDSYLKYINDKTILSKSLEQNGYDVSGNEEKTVSNTDFLIYTLKSGTSTKYFYLTEVNEDYVSMGLIDTVGKGNWENALPVINGINKHIKFDNDSEDVNDVINNVVSDIAKSIK